MWGPGVAYYIYENWQAGTHKAVIHIGTCGFCKHGKGRAGGYDPAHARWLGGYESLDEARKMQKKMVAKVRKECRCVSDS